MEQNKALLERIRLFVLDLDGTIYLGDRLLPGAAEFITTAKEKGRRVLFFTNNTSRSPMEYVERLSRMGIPVTREDILTARGCDHSLPADALRGTKRLSAGGTCPAAKLCGSRDFPYRRTA